jgi:hypothetical protein
VLRSFSRLALNHDSVLVWLDSTSKWENSTEEPWCPKAPSHKHDAVELLPTVRYMHNLALKSHRLNSAPSTAVAFGAPQSAALIHLDYVRSLSHSAVRQDPGYAITELLRLAAASQSQLLNLLNASFTHQKPTSVSTNMVPLTLTYESQILSKILQQTHEVQQSMKNTEDSHWPKATGSAAQRTAKAWAALQADYECLRERAQMTSSRHNEVVAILMNTMMITESHEAIVQAKKVSRLTSMAFIFIPLSFTTSFFGMNVQQMSQQTTSIWVWVVTSSIITGTAIAFLFYEKCVQLFRDAYVRLTGHELNSAHDGDAFG